MVDISFDNLFYSSTDLSLTFSPPKFLSIWRNDKLLLLEINLENGHVKFGPGYSTNDEVSREFWNSLGNYWKTHYKIIES